MHAYTMKDCNRLAGLMTYGMGYVELNGKWQNTTIRNRELPLTCVVLGQGK